MTSDIRHADRAFAGFRLITFFDAALHFFQGNFLAVYALLFLTTEYEVGGLLSYLAAASLAASFAVSYLSDRFKKRVEILYPLLLVMGLLITLMPTVKSVGLLVVLIGIYAVLDNLSLPIRFSVPMDHVPADLGFWRVSELYGNLGRAVIFGVTSALIGAGIRWLAFDIFAVMTVAFPFLIHVQVRSVARTADRPAASAPAQA